MNFITVDVETANSDVGSICQVGMAKYVKGKLIDTYSTLINPQSSFSKKNIEIHGIDKNAVEDAPSIFDVYGNILAFVGDKPIVSYTNFDQRAFAQCLADNSLPAPEWTWVDASVMVRNTCERFAHKGYGLANVCREWNYDFNHHDALEDAKACGFIATTVLRENGLSITDWMNDGKYVSAQSSNKKKFAPKVSIKGNEKGRFFGLNICFTGELSIKRAEIATIAAKHGFTVKAGASKKLDYLVVGTPDLSLLNGHDKSSKQRKTEELVQQGEDIKIIEEHEFLKIIKIVE